MAFIRTIRPNRRFFRSIYVPLFVAIIGLSGCSIFNSNGTLTLSLTDSPIDDPTVTGVWITIQSIEVNLNEEWQTLDDYVPTGDAINLLELTGGISAVLGSQLQLPAGQYNQIRFMLEVAETGDAAPTTPGSYITFDVDLTDDDATAPYADDTIEPLFTPSGGQSGYKAVGEFSVPVNGTVAITADFDVRKAVVETGGSGGNSHYILKPTIRLVVDGEAGRITGTVDMTDAPVGSSSLVVLAYEDGDYTAGEATLDVSDSEASLFPGAVSSAIPDDSDTYILAFIAAGTYDLAVAALDADGELVAVWGVIENVVVANGATTTQQVDSSLF